jgi:hypothetical protein
VEELEQEAVAGVRGDEGAAALAAHQDVLGHQFVDRRRSVPTDTPKRPASSVSLGSASPGGDHAVLDGLQQRALDGAVQRHARGVGAMGGADSRGRAAGSGWRVARILGSVTLIPASHLDDLVDALCRSDDSAALPATNARAEQEHSMIHFVLHDARTPSPWWWWKG